jgi:hypothetical protein
MSKNSAKQTIEQSKSWTEWMIKKGSIKIKKKSIPLYNTNFNNV